MIFAQPNTPPQIAASGYSKRERNCGFAIGVIAIVTSLAIMHGDTTLIDTSLQRYVAIPNYIATLYLFYQMFSSSTKVKYNTYLAIAWAVAWAFNVFHVTPGSEVNITWLSLAVILVFCGQNRNVLHYGFRVFKIFMIVTAITGVIAWFGFMTSLLSPLRVVEYYGAQREMGAVYFVYPFAYLYGGTEGLRLCGLFNEPGYYGTISALILISERFELLKDKWNILILLAGILSFSLAFYVLIILFVSFKLINNPKLIPPIILSLLFLLFIVIPRIDPNSNLGFIVSRFAYDQKEHRFAGDNRNNDAFDIIYEYANIHGDLIFGQGAGATKDEKGAITSSYKTTILYHGYLGAFLMWGLLLWAVIKYKPKRSDEWILIICFFASIYQRPSIFTANYMLVLFGGIANIACYYLYPQNGVSKENIVKNLNKSRI